MLKTDTINFYSSGSSVDPEVLDEFGNPKTLGSFNFSVTQMGTCSFNIYYPDLNDVGDERVIQDFLSFKEQVCEYIESIDFEAAVQETSEPAQGEPESID